jgi:L-alanine-DL-glutamate epimerase-like enolase superfamily enzyme
MKMESLMLRVEAEDGLSGWVEGFGHFVNPATEAALQTQVGPWFLGRDPSDIHSLMDLGHRSFFGFGHHGSMMYALAAVREEGVAIAAGENVHTVHEFRRCLEAGAVDVVQPSVAKVGGITPMRQMIDLAHSYGVRVVPHSFYWGPGCLATAHLTAAMPEPAMLETIFVSFEIQPHSLMNPMPPSLVLPETAGLGFEPDWQALEPLIVDRQQVR